MSTFIPSRVTRYYSTKIKNNQDRNLIRVNGNLIPKSDTMFELGEWGQYVDIDTTSHSYRSRCHTYPPNNYDYYIKNNITNNEVTTNNSHINKHYDMLRHPLFYIIENMIKPCISYFGKTSKNNTNDDIEITPSMIEHNYYQKIKNINPIYSIDEEPAEEDIDYKTGRLKMNPYHMIFVSTLSISAIYLVMLW